MDKCPHCLVPVPKMVVACAHCDELLEFSLAGLGEKETLPSDVIPAEGVVKETARQMLSRMVEEGKYTQAEEVIKAMLHQAGHGNEGKWRSAEVLAHYASLLRLMNRKEEAARMEGRVASLLTDTEERKWKPEKTRLAWAQKHAPEHFNLAIEDAEAEDRLAGQRGPISPWVWMAVGAGAAILLGFGKMLIDLMLKKG